MTQKSARKIGFFSALSICVGSVVGIGIFLKNASVGKNVAGNGPTWLLTWIVSGLIALLVAVHFGKIAKVDTPGRRGAGISTWADQVTTLRQKWFYKFVAFNYGFFYLAILGAALAFFTTELLIAFFREINPAIQLPVWAHVLVALGFLSLFVFTNFFSYKLTGWISSTTLVLKFIPLLLTVVIGIILANNHNIVDPNGRPLTENGFLKPLDGATALKGMMLSLPSVLFAFDAFIGVGALSKQIKGGDRTVSSVIVFGMLFVTVIYTLIALASALHFFPRGTFVANVLRDALPAGAAKGIATFVSLFLFISAYGTSNAIAAVGLKEFEHICTKQQALFTRRLFSRFGAKSGGLLLNLAVVAFWALIMFVPASLQNSDGLIDGFTNLVVVYFFVVYVILIYMFWKNIWLHDESFHPNGQKWGYSLLVWITIVAVAAAVALNFFFLIYDAVLRPSATSSWGLYLDSGTNISNLYSLITYLIMSPCFLVAPVANGWLVSRTSL